MSIMGVICISTLSLPDAADLRIFIVSSLWGGHRPPLSSIPRVRTTAQEESQNAKFQNAKRGNGGRDLCLAIPGFDFCVLHFDFLPSVTLPMQVGDAHPTARALALAARAGRTSRTLAPGTS